MHAFFDILADCSVKWMPHYILHMNMGANLHVWVYLLSDYSCLCMLYYTHHKRKGTHHYEGIDVL